MKKIQALAKEYVVKELQKQLRSILVTMDVPSFRTQYMSQHNLLWLQRNLPINNSEHENFTEAMNLVKMLIRENDA
jgi:hypothetical protein